MAAQHCSPSGAGGYRGVLNQPEAEGNIDNPDVTRHYSGLEAILTHVHALQRLENGGRQELGELREKVLVTLSHICCLGIKVSYACTCSYNYITNNSWSFKCTYR